ncbi:Uncharacterised protein [Mycobacterium tuberculosis]|uniref:Uncharacterized protein n=1 Tax=Mycobacterium tuberculosis TaxID=1773 RepID=A0A655AYC6_MYCTX|nr:Uncharacterised protein [Mycobacterium tuberculosis]CNU35083.1 Uncharacterised protein [Mycobacterium tuberculosis]
MGHQVRGQHVGRRHPGALSDVPHKGLHPLSHAPYSVDVSLRIERERLAVLGQVNRQLRHPQDRVVDPDQPVADPGTVTHR